MSAADENTTTHLTPPYLEKYWLVCQSLFAILTVVAVYLAVCLTRHAFTKKSNSRAGDEMYQQVWLKWLCASSSIMLTLRLCSDQLSAFFGWQSDDLCFATVTVSTVLFALAMYPIYIFLWIRQSIFYANPVIRNGLNSIIIRLSWLTLALMILTGLALTSVYNLPQVTGWEYRATEQGCMEVSVDSPEYVPGIIAACSALFQVSLLGLFVYPLLSKELKKFRAPKVANNNNNSHDKSQSSVSKSEENKALNEDSDDDRDDVFHSTASVQSPLVRPVSPLATNGNQNFAFERTPKVSAESDYDSTSEYSRHDVHGKNVKQMPTRKSSRGRVFGKLGKYQYSKAKTYSVSSGNSASPAVSDSEQSRTKRGNTLIGTLRKTMKPQSKKSQSEEEKEERRKKKQGRKLLTMMKHYARLTAFCVASDIVTATIQIALVLPELVYLLMYDLNLLINLMCIVLTYVEWRSILWPCKIESEEKSGFTRRGRLRRTPTPLRRRTHHQDRVEELRREGNRSMSPARRSSGSGYESGDSMPHIYRPATEMNSLIATTRL